MRKSIFMLILLPHDPLIYTHVDDSSKLSMTPLSLVVGALCGIVFWVALIYFVAKRRQKKFDTDTDSPWVFHEDSQALLSELSSHDYTSMENRRSTMPWLRHDDGNDDDGNDEVHHYY